jgi:hypothetical protein
MSNEAILILSYANSDEKIEILKECISESKKKGYKVILSSGIEVPEDIYKEVDYFIFDKENPVITGEELSKIGGAIFYWMKYPHIENYHCVDFNHSYAVLKLMKNASILASVNGIEKIHIVNYDYIICDDSLLKKHSNSLNVNDVYHYYHTQNENFMNTAIFSVRTDVMNRCFSNINNKSDYCDQGFPILEEFMLKVFRDNNLNIERELMDNIKENNKLDLIATSNFSIPRKVDGSDYNLFLYLSYDERTNKYYIVSRCDINVNLHIKIGSRLVKPISIHNYPNIIELDEYMLDSGIELEVPEWSHKEIFNRNKKLSSCNILDNSSVKKINELEYE